jgi:DNA repair exonuclease SbcCD ATPase subunit
MINEKYLQQALRIKKDFLKVDNTLLDLRDDLNSIQNNLKKALDKLVYIKDNSLDYSNEEEFNKDVMNQLGVFEKESKKAKKLYEDYNEKLESLREEENSLYSSLKKEYPNLSDEKMVNIIQEYIKKKMTK